jgi:hypothetical protein
MDHDTTREQLELAALEPDGLVRLMAGDTPAAQAVAGHLAGCPACADELVRLQRASSVIRGVVREMPPPELRDRILAAIQTIGTPRGEAVAMSPRVAEAKTPEAPEAPVPAAGPTRNGSGRRNLLGWAATVAAAVLLSVATTLVVVQARLDDQATAEARTAAALGDATTAAMSIAAQPDATLVDLNGTTDPGSTGRLSYSPSIAQLVLVAKGLPKPPAGQEYRAWVAIGGKRQRVGPLAYSDGVAYWSGSAPAVAGLAGPAEFGVSLVDTTASGGSPPAVMLGEH